MNKRKPTGLSAPPTTATTPPTTATPTAAPASAGSATAGARVLVGLPVNARHRKFLESCAPECEFIYKPKELVVDSDLEDVSVVIGNIRPTAAAAAPALQWIQLNTAGADEYVAARRAADHWQICCARGAYSIAVSEHMIGMLFDMIRHFGEYHRKQAEHIWEANTHIVSIEGSTVLVLGLGDIGSSFAHKIKGLGAATVIGVRRSCGPKPDCVDEVCTTDELDSVLGRADFVAMVLPGGEETRGIMDERRLRMMKKGSYLVNVGRGNAVDSAALKKVLSEGHLAGVGLDVTDPEPLPADDPLWDMENVFITPHVAGQFYLDETFERIVRIAGRNLRHWTSGEPLENVVGLY
ncbi:D-2-hydroxyacid dehydrogenase [Hornefia porci]|uniref:D-2-hydroxyacid dehydrogenase n=1 Tax=Hornefia porci TaxID=2652292 RepID=UPI0009F9F1D9|nr:D-2-hydroxyacid dehydrogenase [Hornefia porci]